MKVAPEDLFKNISAYYDISDKTYKESYRILRSIQNNPEAEVTIYRSVPDGVASINNGDWVSLSREYAKNEGLHPSDKSKDMPVISMKVKAKDIGWDGNDINEFVYNPKSTSEPKPDNVAKGDIFIRTLNKSERGNPTRSLSTIPDKEGYDKVYKPYGTDGKGFYYVKQTEAEMKARQGCYQRIKS